MGHTPVVRHFWALWFRKIDNYYDCDPNGGIEEKTYVVAFANQHISNLRSAFVVLIASSLFRRFLGTFSILLGLN